MKSKWHDPKHRFVELFDSDTGFYMRTGVLDLDGKDTGVDPFMRSFPGLIDIGVMGHCEHGRSGKCIASGTQCYQSGPAKVLPNMTIENYKSIINQLVREHDDPRLRTKTFQVALGGRGDVDMHENFEEILTYTREKGIVPNFTTSGLGMTKEKAEICKKYCGAVAVSWYRSAYTLDAISMLLDAGVMTNIHYVLGNNTIDEAIHRLKNNVFPVGINAVIFLLHKPVGLGSQDNVLKVDDPRVAEFFGTVDKMDFKFKIGFDSCSIPGILNMTKNINNMSIDTCEGGRYSMYIAADMTAVPCSFDQKHAYGVDLTCHTIQEAWDSESFEAFRTTMREACPACPKKQDCMGGCPIVKEIVLCKEKG